MGTLDAFRMIVGHLRAAFCFLKGRFSICKRKSNRRDAHCRAIAEAIVWLWLLLPYPPSKAPTVTAIGVSPRELLISCGIIPAIQQYFGGGKGQNAVIRKIRICLEKREFLAAVVVELIYRPNNIPNNRPDHLPSSN